VQLSCAKGTQRRGKGYGGMKGACHERRRLRQNKEHTTEGPKSELVDKKKTEGAKAKVRWGKIRGKRNCHRPRKKRE